MPTGVYKRTRLHRYLISQGNLIAQNRPEVKKRKSDSLKISQNKSEVKEKISLNSRIQMLDKEYRKKIHNKNVRKKISNTVKILWEDPLYREKTTNAIKKAKGGSTIIDDTHYRKVHKWIVEIKGKAKVCEFCNTETARRYEWSNKSQEYLFDINDWQTLCTSCHVKYDNSYKSWSTR